MMGRAGNGRKELRVLILLFVVSIFIAPALLSLEASHALRDYLHSCIGISMNEFLIAGVFLYVTGMIWLSYRHWDTIERRHRAALEATRNVDSEEIRLGVLDEMPSYVKRADSRGQWDFFNRAWLEFTGRSMQDEAGEGWMEGVHSEDASRVSDTYSYAFGRRVSCEMVYRLRRRDGQYRWVMDSGKPFHEGSGRFAGYVSATYDITERVLQEQHLSHMATHDPLTDLPNRVLFQDRLRQAVVEAERRRDLVALLFLDLDNFKGINDTLGHEAGDQILKAVSSRLLSCIRTGDTLARLGGDEFLILLPEVVHEKDPAIVAQRILASLDEAFEVDEYRLHLSASIGIALFPVSDGEMQALMKKADAAMYHAKGRGGKTFQFAPDELHERVVRRLSLERGLKVAAERGEFLLRFQPVVDAVRGRIIGAEALIEWEHPEAGIVHPKEFLSLAEETGLIVSIGEWMLRQSCGLSKAWRCAESSTIALVVNISSRQLREDGFSAMVKRILDDAGLEPHSLVVEVSEDALMTHGDHTIKTLAELHLMGVRVSVDDFGSGYSSLSDLKRFPVDSIKIARAFVREVTTSRDDAEIVSAIITMASSLGITAMAEGVDSEDQLACLLEKGCQIVQGDYVGKPMTRERMEELLTTGGGAAGNYPNQKSLPWDE
ncbi:MAG: putative bifunctional diguanylate cyclase/phosphodiesterase [Chloroflexota bacterium]